jgi:hypothetical protein
MLPNVDDSSWPIVRITYGDVITFDEIAELAARLQGIFEKRGPMVMLIDVSALAASNVTALHRRRLAEGADTLAAQGALLGEAVIIPNPILRALYVGYTWACKRKTFPSQSFFDAEAALAWAREQARAALRTRPPPLPPASQ